MATVSFIETPGIVSLQDNPVRFLCGTTLTDKTNLSIHLLIQLWNGSAYADSTLEEVRSVVDGECEFDISEYFAGLLKKEFVFPEHYTNTVIPRSNMVVRYKVKIWEAYEENGEIVDTSSDAVVSAGDAYVVPGGISEDDQAMINTISSTWWDEWIAQKKFQTWLPGEKATSTKAVEKLYWIARRSATESIAIAWKGVDGTTGTATISAAMTAYMMYEICISPSIVKTLAGKDIASYTVTITGQSETVKYAVDSSYYEKEEFFLFENSYGCYESLWCRGFREGELKMDRTEYERLLSYKYISTDRRFGNTRAKITRNRKSNTGYLENMEWFNWALALIQGEDAWIYGENSIAPVYITSDKLDYVDDLKDIWNLSFEWNHSREGRFGSAMQIALEYILPPYFDKIAAFFYKTERGGITDMIKGLTAVVSGSDITWPEITGSDVLDFSDATFWDNSGLTWYSAGTPRKCPLSFMVGGTWAPAATASTHARLFHKDYSTKVRDMLPVIIYKQDLTADEQAVVVDWLDWYFVLTQSGSVLTQGSNLLIQ